MGFLRSINGLRAQQIRAKHMRLSFMPGFQMSMRRPCRHRIQPSAPSRSYYIALWSGVEFQGPLGGNLGDRDARATGNT